MTSESVGVRPFRSGDRARCLAIFDGNVPRFFAAEERPDFEAFLDHPDGPYRVLEGPDGRIVACGGWAVAPGSTTADLCWGMVDAALHGRGLGRALTLARLRDVRAAGNVDALALRTSQRTVGFYERLGFRVVEVVPDGFGPGLDRCEMRLELRPRPAGPAGRPASILTPSHEGARAPKDRRPEESDG